MKEFAFLFDYNFSSGLKYIKENNYINMMYDRIEYTNSKTAERMKDVKKISLEYIEERTKR